MELYIRSVLNDNIYLFAYPVQMLNDKITKVLLNFSKTLAKQTSKQTFVVRGKKMVMNSFLVYNSL